jgi:16S rRNA processing protein RimM
VKKELITIGLITKAHGLHGTVVVHPLTYDVNRFEKIDRVYLNDRLKRKLNIEELEIVSSNQIRVKFRESNSRLEADGLRKKEIMIPEDEMIKLPDDVYFLHDLIGCDVHSSKRGFIGKISNVLSGGGNDLYVINYNDKEVLIPAVSNFIKHIDIENKKIDIDEIPGLID